MMELTKEEYRNFVEILKEELTPAFGCTEPIAIAYCAAKARETLGCLPEKVVIEASGNIIKKCEECNRSEYRQAEGNSGGCSSRDCGRRSFKDPGGDCTGF